MEQGVNMDYSLGEREYLKKVGDKLNCLRDFLNSDTVSFNDSSLQDIQWHIAQIKSILGNFDNDVSFTACLMAKEYLHNIHPSINLDVSAKPQSAPGLDIDTILPDNLRVIAEIKTTFPYGKNGFGSKQKEMFLKDFKKLQEHQATYKYFFVTEKMAFGIIEQRYMKYLDGVNLVLLSCTVNNDLSNE